VVSFGWGFISLRERELGRAADPGERGGRLIVVRAQPAAACILVPVLKTKDGGLRRELRERRHAVMN